VKLRRTDQEAERTKQGEGHRRTCAMMMVILRLSILRRHALVFPRRDCMESILRLGTAAARPMTITVGAMFALSALGCDEEPET
jgi:hypothetical protein